jgi:hypothetical protein
MAISVRGNIAGENFDGVVILPEYPRVRVRFVDGVAYGKARGVDWQTSPDFEQQQTLNPFTLLGAHDLQYVGRTRRGGRAVHHLHTDKWIGGDLASTGLEHVDLQSSPFEIYVSNDGIPIEAVLTATLFATAGGQRGQLEYTVTYKFSNVGKRVRIVAPI